MGVMAADSILITIITITADSAILTVDSEGMMFRFLK